MNLKQTTTVAFAISTLIGLAGAAHGQGVAPPPEVAQVADTWIGYTDNDLSLYRLTLHKDGSGTCAFVFVRNPALLYEVTEWRLDEYDINISLKPIDETAEPISITGETTGWLLRLKVAGEGWDRDLKMYRESDFDTILKKLKDRMQKPRADDGR